MKFATDQLTPDEAYDVALDVMDSHSAKHEEIRRVRDVVRQRVTPQKVMEDKYLITSRSAMAWAIVMQARSYFKRATRKVLVKPHSNDREEDKRTSKLENWLMGSSKMINRRSRFVESNAIYHGLETGVAILGASMNITFARNGLFPIEVVAPDPECCAYAWSHAGLTNFVWQELRPVSALQVELSNLKQRAKGIDLDTTFENLSSTDDLEDLRFFTNTHEYRWLDGELVYARKHFCGRVPFDVAYFYDTPSDRPEEWGRGIISPVRDLLESQQQLIDLFVTDAELGQRPLGILFDGEGKFNIVQISPGEDYDGTSLTPVPYNPNHQLLQEIGGMINEQLDYATLPRSTFSGPQMKLSGYAIERYVQGVNARMDDLKEYPENMLASNYELRLQIAQRFATDQMARKLASGDPDRYLASFAVMGQQKTKKGSQPQRVWFNLTADDIYKNPWVEVSLSPILPADMSQKLTQAQQALASGFSFEWTVRNIFEADNVDELLEQREFDMLLANNAMFRDAFMAYVEVNYLESDKKFAKFYLKWIDKQKLLEQQDQPPPDMNAMPGEEMPPQGMPPQGNIPPELQFIPQGAAQTPPPGQGEIPPELLALIARAGQVQPQREPDLENLPPNAAMAQVLMGMGGQ